MPMVRQLGGSDQNEGALSGDVALALSTRPDAACGMIDDTDELRRLLGDDLDDLFDDDEDDEDLDVDDDEDDDLDLDDDDLDLEDDEEEDDDLDLDDDETELVGATEVSCPYCGAPNDWVVDVGGGHRQEYVEDCQVCCQPCAVRIDFVDGQPSVWVQPLTGE